MRFYGREAQQKELRTLLRRNPMQVALVYGRPSVGKSELIKHCLRQEPIRQIYFECKQTAEQNNAESLSALISELFGLLVLGFGSMEAVLESQQDNPMPESSVLHCW